MTRCRPPTGCAAVGRYAFERHHLAGRHNAPETNPLRANVHRAVTDEQRDWPEETWRNPHGTKLRRDAAWIRALIDNQRLNLDHLQSVVEELELIDEALTQRYGDGWRERIGLPTGDDD